MQRLSILNPDGSTLALNSSLRMTHTHTHTHTQSPRANSHRNLTGTCGKMLRVNSTGMRYARHKPTMQSTCIEITRKGIDVSTYGILDSALRSLERHPPSILLLRRLLLAGIWKQAREGSHYVHVLLSPQLDTSCRALLCLDRRLIRQQQVWTSDSSEPENAAFLSLSPSLSFPHCLPLFLSRSAQWQPTCLHLAMPPAAASTVTDRDQPDLWETERDVVLPPDSITFVLCCDSVHL